MDAVEELTERIKQAADKVARAPHWQAYNDAYREWARLCAKREAIKTSPATRLASKGNQLLM